MAPSREPLGQRLGDGVFLDQPRERVLAEEPHQRFGVPAREGVEALVVRERVIGDEQVAVGMPLQQVAAGGDPDDDPGRGRLSAPLRMYSLRASAPHCERSSSSAPFPEYASLENGQNLGTRSASCCASKSR